MLVKLTTSRNLVKSAESSGVELLTGCDANSQNVCWRSSKCNHSREKLFVFITSASLMTANVEYAPKFVGARRDKLIEFKICTSKMLRVDWRMADGR